jgi:hypothetical protein
MIRQLIELTNHQKLINTPILLEKMLLISLMV